MEGRMEGTVKTAGRTDERTNGTKRTLYTPSAYFAGSMKSGVEGGQNYIACFRDGLINIHFTKMC